MGKYKNDFCLTGDAVLLNAFIQKLVKLDYKLSLNYDKEYEGQYLHVYGWNGSKTSPTCFNYYPEEFSLKEYKLPLQWDEALKLASELKTPEFKVGDWVDWAEDYTKDGKQLYRIKALSTTDVTIEWWNLVKGDKDYATYEIHYLHQYGKLATQEQIKEHLIVTSQIKFKNAERIEGVRDVEIGEIYSDKGVRNTRIQNKSKSQVSFEEKDYFRYDEKTDTLYNFGRGVVILYEKGKWAKPLNPFPKLYNYEAEEVGGIIKYGCKSFHKSKVKELVEQITNFNKSHGTGITSVTIGEYSVKVEELQQIAKEISSSK